MDHIFLSVSRASGGGFSVSMHNGNPRRLARRISSGRYHSIVGHTATYHVWQCEYATDKSHFLDYVLARSIAITHHQRRYTRIDLNE